MRILSFILAVLITTINSFRYYLPERLNEISVFDVMALIALLLTTVVAILPKRNVLTEGILLYNVLGCLDSISDEIFFDATARTKGDLILLPIFIVICVAYIWVRVNHFGAPFAQFKETKPNEWNPSQTKLPNHGG